MKTLVRTTTLALASLGLVTAAQASTVGEKSPTTSNPAFEAVAHQDAAPTLAPTDKHSAAGTASPAFAVRSHGHHLAIVHPGEKRHGFAGRGVDAPQLADTATR